MANTTFSGPVRSENGFDFVTKKATTGAFTTNASYGKGITGSIQSLSGAGAINLTDLITAISATGTSDALTLADGTAGQIKILTYVAESAGGDSSVVTPTTFANGSTITLDAVGDGCVLVYNETSGWAVVGSIGIAVA